MIINHPFLWAALLGAVFGLGNILRMGHKRGEPIRESLGIGVFAAVILAVVSAMSIGALLSMFTVTETECVPIRVSEGASGVDTVYIYQDAKSRIEIEGEDAEGRDNASWIEADIIQGSDTTWADFSQFANTVVLPEAIKVLEEDGTLRTIPRVSIDYRPYDYPPRYEYEKQHTPGGARLCWKLYGAPEDNAPAGRS